jgi:hypothetical protein
MPRVGVTSDRSRDNLEFTSTGRRWTDGRESSTFAWRVSASRPGQVRRMCCLPPPAGWHRSAFVGDRSARRVRMVASASWSGSGGRAAGCLRNGCLVAEKQLQGLDLAWVAQVEPADLAGAAEPVAQCVDVDV